MHATPQKTDNWESNHGWAAVAILAIGLFIGVAKGPEDSRGLGSAHAAGARSAERGDNGNGAGNCSGRQGNAVDGGDGGETCTEDKR